MKTLFKSIRLYIVSICLLSYVVSAQAVPLMKMSIASTCKAGQMCIFFNTDSTIKFDGAIRVMLESTLHEYGNTVHQFFDKRFIVGPHYNNYSHEYVDVAEWQTGPYDDTMVVRIYEMNGYPVDCQFKVVDRQVVAGKHVLMIHKEKVGYSCRLIQ